MVTVDETYWPVLAIHFPGAVTEDDVGVYNGTLERAIARGERWPPAYLFRQRLSSVYRLIIIL